MFGSATESSSTVQLSHNEDGTYVYGYIGFLDSLHVTSMMFLLQAYCRLRTCDFYTTVIEVVSLSVNDSVMSGCHTTRVLIC